MDQAKDPVRGNKHRHPSKKKYRQQDPINRPRQQDPNNFPPQQDPINRSRQQNLINRPRQQDPINRPAAGPLQLPSAAGPHAPPAAAAGGGMTLPAVQSLPGERVVDRSSLTSSDSGPRLPGGHSSSRESLHLECNLNELLGVVWGSLEPSLTSPDQHKVPASTAPPSSLHLLNSNLPARKRGDFLIFFFQA